MSSERRTFGRLATLAALGLVAVIAGCRPGSDEPATPDAGASTTSEQVDAELTAEVVLGLYSGRPDPTWMLTADQAAGLATALGRLTRADGTAPSGGLGYHGFTIVTPDGTFVAYAGKVARAGADPPFVLDDPDRTIERLLLDTAQPHVSQQERTIVAAALEGP